MVGEDTGKTWQTQTDCEGLPSYFVWTSRTVLLDWQTGVVISLFKEYEDHNPQPPWQGRLRGTREKGLLDSQTSDSEGAMW